MGYAKIAELSAILETTRTNVNRPPSGQRFEFPEMRQKELANYVEIFLTAYLDPRHTKEVQRVYHDFFQMLQNSSLCNEKKQILSECILNGHKQYIKKVRSSHEKFSEKQGRFLHSAMAEIYRLFSEFGDYFKMFWKDRKSESFSIAWKGKPSEDYGLCQESIQALKAYQKKWTVGADRKKIVTTLITELESAEDQPLAILEKINAARAQILDDDLARKNFFISRCLGDGLNGRLYQLLGNIKAQVIALASPKQLDDFLEKEMDEIQTVLNTYVKYIKAEEAKVNYILPADKQLCEHIAKISENGIPIAERYNRLNAFFAAQIASARKKSRVLNTDLDRPFYVYCQKKQNELGNYISQCDKYAKLLVQEAVTWRRIGMTAVSDLILEVRSKVNGSKRIKKDHVWQRGNLNSLRKGCSFGVASNLESRFHHNLFFNRVHNAVFYKALLNQLEEKIKTAFGEKTAVKFNHINAESDNQAGDSYNFRFKVTIAMIVDNKPHNLIYHFNTYEMTCHTEWTDKPVLADQVAVGRDFSTCPIKELEAQLQEMKRYKQSIKKAIEEKGKEKEVSGDEDSSEGYTVV